ncbi:hypothetical protein XNC1_p0143 (plasmid) [Xenorhabdus nematophila ATCC 19061]|uniref:Uncharacterized protein n=2 Tax=Xenorhabdus nematophila TaxID=628 RepID=D3VM59_XENNA|nr:hypothetical protein XNC1_p0143 [Xenorhabdus nematophila ATCC 19061]CEK25632.1 conserved protein of unknown function [Xenorhabdus nematophila AN6/1]
MFNLEYKMTDQKISQQSSNVFAPPSAEESSAHQIIARRALENIAALAGQAQYSTFRAASANALSETISTSQFSLASALIHTWVYSNPTINYSSGKKVKFKGEAWGIAIGAGVIWLSGWMAPPDQVIGDVDFTLITSPTTTEIWLRKNGDTIGVLIGGGINVQAGAVNGSGKIESA